MARSLIVQAYSIKVFGLRIKDKEMENYMIFMMGWYIRVNLTKISFMAKERNILQKKKDLNQ